MNTKSNRPSIEPLESRIAPARLIEVGLPNNPNDTDYNESPFVNLETAQGSDLIAAAVGKGIPGIADTFYIRLSAGDTIELFRFGGGAATEPLLIVKTGNIVAFFTDKNLDNEVQEGEITGISMGKNASFELRAALPGDVVANLDEKGTKDQADDSLFMGGGGMVPANFGIKSVKIGSSVGGSVDEGILFQTATESVTGGVGVQEVQDFSINNNLSVLGQSFRVSYGGYTSISLVTGSSELAVENALNTLKAITDAGGVTVSSLAQGEYTVMFKLAGDQPEQFIIRADHAIDFTASESTPGNLVTKEVQSIDIGLIAGRAGRLTFSFGASTTVPLAFDVTATQVQSAFNILSAVQVAGGLTVGGPVGGPFTFTFNEFGNQGAVTAHAEEFVTGVVGGSFLASGNITNIVVAGGVQQILAGSAADGAHFDFFPSYTNDKGVIVNTPGGDGTFSFQPASGKAGPVISKIIVDRLGVGGDKIGRIEAGKGGDGAKGGSINNIEIRRDSDGFSLLAGDAGNSSPTKTKGGLGGSITNIYIDGATDDTGNSPVSIIAGAGGDSSISSGGKGGSVSNLYIGYRLLNGKLLFTDSPLRDDVLVRAGTGGDGKIGASGGSLSNLKITVAAPDSAGDEVGIYAGNGGAGVVATGGKAGIGGSISRSSIQNVDLSLGHDMTISAGSGGTAGTDKTTGAAGGSLVTLTVTGRQFDIEAGDGSDGKTGGNGGSVKSLTFTSVNGVVTDTVTLNSGRGGDGLAGKAGNGGTVKTISLLDADLFNFTINDSSLGKGDGGSSTGSKGGSGGSVADVKITDSDLGITVNGANIFNSRAGKGGGGDKGGGAGGSLSNVQFSGTEIDTDVKSGDGGDALISGAGGKAGSINHAELSSYGTVLKMVAGVPTQVAADSFVRAGVGGDGAGTHGIGGLGGSVNLVVLNTQGTAAIAAGNGGSGAGAAPGKGGNIQFSGLFASEGDGSMIAGDGGVDGTKPAAGGSITGRSDELPSGAFAANNITVQAGSGTNGGAGGSIKFFGYGSTAKSLTPTPFGDINILAGDGSQSTDGRYVGAGGSLSSINGSVSFSKGTTTLIQAGAGGSTPKKGGAGGSVNNVSLQLGGNPGVEVAIVAGDAGDSPMGNTGAKGGSVSGVNVIELSEGAIFRHITGGDGGDAVKKGGTGGSVSNVNVVNHDIGVRSGVPFGYDSMGGIFVGTGGSAAAKGIAGSATSITADAIGSIVAGRGAVPQLVNKVENIYLNDSKLLIESEGAFEPNGIPGTTEVQRFTPSDGRAFQIDFGGSKTILLAANSTTTAVEAALNNLPSIANIGGVTVTQAVGSKAYRVTFNQAGDRSPLHITNRLDTFEFIRGATFPTIFEVQSVRIDPEQFKGVSATFGIGNTVYFPDASLLTAATLDAGLDGITGGVSVVEQADHTFQITFNSAQNEPLIVFDAEKRPTPLATEVRNGALPSSIVYINGAERTAPLAKDAAPGDVANALNALPSIITAGGITATALLPNGYHFEFISVGNNPQITAEEVANASSTEELAGEIDTKLKVTEEVQGDLAKQVQEVQTVQIDTRLLGTVTMNFGASATAFNSQLDITATTLEARLNLLANIAAAGGVKVVSLADHTFQITFNQPGDQIPINFEGNDLPLGYAAQIQDGGLLQEIQSFTTNPSGFAGDPRVGFEITFGADKTNLLPATSTAAEVEAELNSLQSIIDAGGVTVTKDTTLVPGPLLADTDSFTVTFNAIGNQEPLYVLNHDIDSHGVALPLFSTSVRTMHGFVDPNDANNKAFEHQLVVAAPVDIVDNGFFYLTFKGSGTIGIPSGASAATVENRLNALNTIVAVGGVTVTTFSPGVYEVVFTVEGAQPLFINTAIEVPQLLNEVIHGVNRLDANEVQSIVYNPDGRFKVTFPVILAASEDIQGSFASGEAQVLDLKAVEAIPAAQFTLKFGSDTTTPLAFDATSAQIEAALNLLPSINAAGNVTVTLTSPGVFTFAFGQLADQLGVITGVVTGPENTVDVNGNDTPANVATALQTALNALPSVAAEGGVTVAVAKSANTLNVIFNTAGNKPSLTAVSNVYEVQTIALLSLGEYNFTYGADTTPRLPAGSTPAAVKQALENLPGFPVGGVTVSNGLNNNFTFTFNAPGDFTAINAQQFLGINASTLQDGTANPAGLHEKQDITQPRRYLFDQANLTLANFVGGFSDGTELDPHIFRWTDANSNGLFDLGEIPTDGIILAKNYNAAHTNFIPEARYVGGEFSFIETTAGGIGIAEVETFTIKADKFTLVFDGDQTAVLSGKSNASSVAKALNALPSIINAGGVNVTSSATNEFTVTFSVPGERTPILAPFFYDFNNILH